MGRARIPATSRAPAVGPTRAFAACLRCRDECRPPARKPQPAVLRPAHARMERTGSRSSSFGLREGPGYVRVIGIAAAAASCFRRRCAGYTAGSGPWVRARDHRLADRLLDRRARLARHHQHRLHGNRRAGVGAGAPVAAARDLRRHAVLDGAAPVLDRALLRRQVSSACSSSARATLRRSRSRRRRS
jgi:hypothetical protein